MTFKDLTASEWAGVWHVRIQVWFCGLRGHPWGPWEFEAPDFSYGPGCRMCLRCEAYELRDR